MKRLASAALALLLVLLMLPVAFADDDIELPEIGGNDPCGDFLQWEYEVTAEQPPAHRLVVFGKGAMYNYTASSPAPWRDLIGVIDALALPDRLTTVGDYAFAGISNLRTVAIPNGVTRIGVNAFDGCGSLTTIEFDGTRAQWNGIAKDANIPERVTVNCLREGELTLAWNESDVSFNGTTPYVLYTGTAKTPRFTVRDAQGIALDEADYTFRYLENTQPGTGYVEVTMQNGYTGTLRGMFKIYLPATTSTTVENTAEGIRVSWSPVAGAAGYVIYRRAWSSTTDGWTTFARWNNTTDTTYLDGADASHKVYAGTRYQYGVKAYFARRTDPVTGAQIGGNVNEPSGNFNLGQVGPLKTTVRITTRTLNSVSGGSKQLTVKWGASANFTGYEVQIATDSGFTKNVKTVKIDEPKTAQTTVKGLKAKTTYYVRVRSYHAFNGMTYCGGWSNVKTAKTK